MINNKIISLIYKTILVIFSFKVNFEYVKYFSGNTLTYFTMLSNILVFFIFFILWLMTIIDVFIKKEYKGYNEHILIIKGIPTLCITVTFLVYAFMLADYSSSDNYSLQNLLEHYIIPILVILDYFLFDKKGKMKWFHPLISMGTALMYLPYIFIRALILGNDTDLIRYPYFFLDPNDVGINGVIIYCIILIVFFSILSYLHYLFDRLYSKKKTSLE